MRRMFISLDVFDTLIFRTVAKPEDVFDLICDAPGFRKKRIEAQRWADAAASLEEYTLEDIYAFLPGHDPVDVAVYVSSEYGLLKKTGSLFKTVIAEQRTENILHIGDHIISDYVRPKQAGMKAVLYGERKSKKS